MTFLSKAEEFSLFCDSLSTCFLLTCTCKGETTLTGAVLLSPLCVTCFLYSPVFSIVSPG
jgi:hypothetical protein